MLVTQTQTPQLGVLPLIAWGVATAAGLAAGGWGLKTWFDLSDYEAWKGTLQPPKAGPAPAAPQTRDQMLSWNPEQLLAADRQNWLNWRTSAIPDPPAPPKNDNTQLWIAAGVAAAALLVITR